MRRVLARCILIVFGMGLVACSPNLPGVPFLAPSTPAGPQKSSPALQASAASIPPPTSGLTQAPTPNPTEAFTPIPTFTATGAPLTPVTQNTTAAQATGTVTAVTPTSIESISLDKLPPGTIYKRVRIENQAHEQMDISLHGTTKQGLHTVIEYNNVKNMTVEVPDGDYVYVFYVGGHRLVGSFSLLHESSVVLTVYKDRVAVH